MATFKSFLQNFLQKFNAPMPVKHFYWHCALLLVAALLLRVLLALPALQNTSSLLRPDSMGYWNPACAIAAGDGLVTEPGSTALEVVRPVGYPAFLAPWIRIFGQSLLPAALAGILISASGCIPIVLTARRFFGERCAITSGWLWALNLTGVAAAPLILSDTLLGVLAAWQFFFAVTFIKEQKLYSFALLTFCSILCTLVKPVNLPIVLCALPLILFLAKLPWRDLLRGAMIWAILICGLLLPYWIRNAALCGDFDGNTANLYFHNGSAVMAHATQESSEVWRDRLLAAADKEFQTHPEKYPTLKEKNRWKKAQFRKLIQEYPLDFIVTHLPNIFNLLPDVPTLLENNHVTRSGRGTMAVLRQKGFTAAVNHYFDGKWQIMLWLLPLLAVYLLTCLMAVVQLLVYLRHWYWRNIMVFLILAFYYIWAPGPVISPRYLLPALPAIIFMAIQLLSCYRNKSTFNHISQEVQK